MYNEFYGFSENPFNLKPEPRFLYLARSHFDALSGMMSGILEKKGIIVVTGEVGVGKTTLIHALMKDVNGKIKTAFVIHPSLDFKDLLKAILRDLEVPFGGKEETIPSLRFKFRKYLEERRLQDETVAIIIDEAQVLQNPVIEDLATLRSPHSADAGLVQIVLVGQLELEEKLNSERLSGFKERIAVQRRIRPLTREESRGYLKYRLKLVGRKLDEVFTAAAVDRVWEFSEGIPRVMNAVCDRALIIGYTDSKRVIDSRIVEEAIGELKYLKAREAELPTPVLPPVHSHYKVIGFLMLLALGLGVGALLYLWPLWFAPERKDRIAVLQEAARDETAVLKQPATEARKINAIPPAEEQRVLPAVPPPRKKEQEIIEVRQGWTISFIAGRSYAAVNPTLIDFILEANPEIKDMHSIFPGQKIRLPEITPKSVIIQISRGAYYVQLGTFRSLNAARSYTGAPFLRGKNVGVLSRQVALRETWYRVILGVFDSEKEALRTVAALKEQGLLPLWECAPRRSSEQLTVNSEQR